MKISATAALRNAFGTKPLNRHPDDQDTQRSRDGLLFPSINPGFSIAHGDQIFTMGSCFARNIEEVLAPNFHLPSLDFSSPQHEWQGRPNGLLNEYNPAAMSQRLRWAADGTDTSTMLNTLSGEEDSCIDLLLAVGQPVTQTRACQRRQEIDRIYAQMRDCSVLVLTLGLVECWFDIEAGMYLNRNPLPKTLRANPERYRFERLNVNESFAMMSSGIEAALACGVKNVLLTVSPVPLQTTFSGQDCVTANSYSKAVLRTTAEMLVERFQDRLDYFPSYEIATSGGLMAFGQDHVHVRPKIVEKIVAYLLERYIRDETA